MSPNNTMLGMLYDTINKPSMNCVEKPESWKSFDSFRKEFITASKGCSRYFFITSLVKPKQQPSKISIDDFIFSDSRKMVELLCRIKADQYLFKKSKERDVAKFIDLLQRASTATESQLERVTELLYTYHI